MVYQLQVVTFHYVLIIHVLFHRWDEIYYTSYVVLVKTRNVKLGVKSSENQARKKGNVLFNDALNIFCLWLNGDGHVVKDYSDGHRGNLLLPPHGLLLPVSSKGSFICTIIQTG